MIDTLIVFANRVHTFLGRINLQRVIAVMLASLVMIGTLAPAGALAAQTENQLRNKASDLVDDDESNRPKTTREWNAEARETADQPVERTKRIVEETADAIQDWAEIYPDVAERSIPALQDN